MLYCARSVIVVCEVTWRYAVSAQSRSAREKQSFLTPEEVSQLLRVSVYTVRRWIKQGDLPAYKVGRGWRIRGEAIDEWLSQHQSVAEA